MESSIKPTAIKYTRSVVRQSVHYSIGSTPLFKKVDLPAKMNLWAKSIFKFPSNDEPLSTATSTKFETTGKTSCILLNRNLPWSTSSWWLYTLSDHQCIKVQFFKCSDISSQKTGKEWEPIISYELSNTSIWTSCMFFITDQHSESYNSLNADISGPLILDHTQLNVLLPQSSKKVITLYLLAVF